MPEGGIDFEIHVDNLEEFKAALEAFPPMLQNDLYAGFQRIAAREEKILKGTAGFRDRTGRSRRSLYVVATWRPLGIEMGSWLPHMKWLAEGHGTWEGNWWAQFLRDMTPRVVESLQSLLKRVVDKYNTIFGRM